MVSDMNHGSAIRQLIHCFQDSIPGILIQSRDQLIQQNNGGILTKRSGYLNPLRLTAGHLISPLTHISIQAIRKTPDPSRRLAASQAAHTVFSEML